MSRSNWFAYLRGSLRRKCKKAGVPFRVVPAVCCAEQLKEDIRGAKNLLKAAKEDGQRTD